MIHTELPLRKDDRVNQAMVDLAGIRSGWPVKKRINPKVEDPLMMHRQIFRDWGSHVADVRQISKLEDDSEAARKHYSLCDLLSHNVRPRSEIW
jgi:hypothetical protein